MTHTPAETHRLRGRSAGHSSTTANRQHLDLDELRVQTESNQHGEEEYTEGKRVRGVQQSFRESDEGQSEATAADVAYFASQPLGRHSKYPVAVHDEDGEN